MEPLKSKDLINIAKSTFNPQKALPFSVYSSVHQQRVLNVPISKPLLICILAGVKNIGENNEIACLPGSFLFLSNTSAIHIRNIPLQGEYFAVVIEFDYSDFAQFGRQDIGCEQKYITGNIDESIALNLKQFMQWSVLAPQSMWHFRRQELLRLLYELGYKELSSLVFPPSLGHQVDGIMQQDIRENWNAENIAEKLSISESTLRRKLKSEGVSIKLIRDQVRLGRALHLLQTTVAPIGLISENCGYSSQSRFADKFKQRFGVTPKELRKTQGKMQTK